MRYEQESGVRQLLARSSDCVWRKDLDGYGACWSRNGEWRIMGGVYSGRDTIKAAWWGFMDPLRGAWQVAENVILEADGETVHGRIYLRETLVMPDNATMSLTMGIYHDTYVVEDGVWVFARRHFDLLALGTPDTSTRFFATADYGTAPRDPDPSRPATPSVQEAYGS